MSINPYKTTSLALAAALLASTSATLLSIERSPNSSRALFCFDSSNEPHLDQIVSKFFSKTLHVDAFTYFESLRFVKSRLYEEHP